MKIIKLKKFIIIFIALFFVSLILAPTNVLASSVFGSVDIENLDLSRIDKSKVNELKGILEDFKDENANTINKEDLDNMSKEDIKNSINSIDVKSIDINGVLNTYKEISNVISNKDMAYLIEDNKDILTSSGVNKNLVDASVTLFNTFDADAVIEIAQNDLDIEALFKAYQEGASIDSLIISVIDNTSITTSLKIACKLLFANSFFRLLIALFIVVGIYSIFITGIIFKKAGKKSFFTVIPIYRDIIHLKLCNFSPWLLILVFIPIIGWLALMSIAVIRKI